MNRPVPFRAGTIPGALRPLVLPAFTGTYTLLADVSEFQPDVADATYLRWSKAIIIRALYGDAHDDKAWYGGDRRAQLHAGGARFVGCYQYLVGTQSGAAQAQAFHSLVGAIEPGEVFIADFEEGAKGVLSAWYNEMLKLYGAKIGPYLWTYSGLNFGQAAGVLPVEWIAAYQSAEPTSKHKLWQFTDKYQVPGVGSCDCSVAHMSIDQLAALAYGAPPETGTQNGWAWCRRCRGMFFGALTGHSRCPLGGQHDGTGSYDYGLAYGSLDSTATIQPRWRHCGKCQGLFYGPAAGSSRCPAGGQHVMQGLAYLLNHGATGPGRQAGWNCCARCQGLFYGRQADLSHCPAGGRHDATGSLAYVIGYSR